MSLQSPLPILIEHVDSNSNSSPYHYNGQGLSVPGEDASMENSTSTDMGKLTLSTGKSPPVKGHSIPGPGPTNDFSMHTVKAVTPEPEYRNGNIFSSPRPPRIQRRETVDTATIKKEEREDASFVNQYEVMDIIGHGAYGIVHKASNSIDGDTYAMKILAKRKLMRKKFPLRRPGGRGGIGVPAPDPLADIHREIAILKKLDHENVVKLVEVLEDPSEDDLILVFEYISNGSIMKEISPKNKMSEADARLYFTDLILGLEYLHSRKVIHRDIKPENLLLDQCNVLKIADFGVSEIWETEETDTKLHKSAGTPAFTAPETLYASSVFSGKPLDIWAAGCTLYCFIYGKVPFVARAIPDLYEKIKSAEVKYPEDVPISIELHDLFTKLFTKNPEERITIPEIRQHPWFIATQRRIPTTEENCHGDSSVTEEEIEQAVQPFKTPIHILVMIKQMAKTKSLRNPYQPGIAKSPVGSPAIQRSQKDKQKAFAFGKNSFQNVTAEDTTSP